MKMAHILPHADKVGQLLKRDVIITPANESKARLAYSGAPKVLFLSDGGPEKLRLLDIVLFPDAGVSLISVLTLTTEDIGMLFMSGCVVLYDQIIDFAVLGYAN